MIRLNISLLKEARTDRVSHGFIKASVSVSGGFVNRLGNDLVKLFRLGLEKGYSENLVECPVVVTHVSRASATSVSYRSYSQGEAESGPNSLKRQIGGQTARHQRREKGWGRR